MKKVGRTLLSLLRTSLWGASLDSSLFPLQEQEWIELYSFARKQGVHTLVFDAVETLPHNCAPPRSVIGRWLLETDAAEQSNELADSAVVVQNRCWRAQGVKAVLLKGQYVAAMYPHPYRRLCGDIDWYFPTENDWNRANAYASSIGCSLEKDSDGDVHYVWKGITIEHHRNWFHLGSRKADAFLKSIEREYDEWNGVSVLTPELTLVMLSLHILKHAAVLGVGLRQICDFAMACRTLSDRVDPQKYQEMCSAIGLKRWNELIHSVVVDVIGLDERYLPYPLKRHRHTGHFMLLVSQDGNLGMHCGGDFRSMNRVRRVAYLLNAYLRRAGFFLFYVPGEVTSRSWNLLIGRIARKQTH